MNKLNQLLTARPFEFAAVFEAATVGRPGRALQASGAKPARPSNSAGRMPHDSTPRPKASESGRNRNV
jgi:hypothetical protein